MEIDQCTEMFDSFVRSQQLREETLSSVKIFAGEYDGREVPHLERYGLGSEVKTLVKNIKNEWLETIPVVKASTGSGKSTLITYYASTGRTIVVTPFRVAALNLISWANVNKLPGFGICIQGVVKNVDTCRILVGTADYFKQRIDLLDSADLFIFDEMHVANPAMVNILSYAERRKKPIIGLSATFNPKSYRNVRPFKVYDREVPKFKIAERREVVDNPINKVVNLIEMNLDKNILVFCPGQNTIDRIVARVKERQVHKFMSGVDTQTIPGIGKVSEKKFCIASTNALETAVTVRDLDMVIDLAVEKTPTWDDYVFSLPVRPITVRASTQRKGRVGREKDGTYIRVTRSDWKYSEDKEITWGWLQDVEQAGMAARMGIGNPSEEARMWYQENKKYDNIHFPTSLLYNIFINKMNETGAGVSAFAYILSLEEKDVKDYRIFKNLVRSFPEAKMLSDVREVEFEDVRGFFGNVILAGRDPRGEKVESGDGAFVTMFRNDKGKLEPVGFLPGKVETETFGENKFIWTVMVLVFMFLISSTLLSYLWATIGLIIAWIYIEPLYLIPLLLLQILSYPIGNAELMSTQIEVNWRLSAQLIGLLGIFVPVFSYTYGFKRGMSDSSTWSFVTKKTFEQSKAFLAGFPSARLSKKTFPLIAYRALMLIIIVGILVLVLNNPLDISISIPWASLLDIPPSTFYFLVLWTLLGWYMYVKGYNSGIDYGVTMLANADFSRNVEKYSQSFNNLVERLSWQGLVVLIFMVVVCVGLATVVTSVKQMSAVEYDDPKDIFSDLTPLFGSLVILAVPIFFVKLRIGTDDMLVWKSIRSLTGKCVCTRLKVCEVCKITNYDNYLEYLSKHIVSHTVGFPSELVVEHSEECKNYCVTMLDECASNIRLRIREVPNKSSDLKKTLQALTASDFQSVLSLRPDLLNEFTGTDLLVPHDFLGEANRLINFWKSTVKIRLDDDEFDPILYVGKADQYVQRHIDQIRDAQQLQNRIIPLIRRELKKALKDEAAVRTTNAQLSQVLQEIAELRKMEGFSRTKYANVLTFLRNQGIDVTTKPSYINFPQIVSLPDYGSSVKILGLSLISFLGFWSLFSFSLSTSVLVVVLIVTVIITLVRGLYSTYRVEVAFGRIVDLDVTILFSRGFLVYKGHNCMPILTKNNILPPLVKVSDLSVWLEIIFSVVMLMWFSGFRLYSVSFELEGMGSSILDFLPNLIVGVDLYPVTMVAVPTVLRTLSSVVKNPSFFKPEFDGMRMSISMELVKIAMRGESLAGFNSLFPGLSPNIASQGLDPDIRLLTGQNYDVDLGSNCTRLFAYPGHTASKPSIGCENPAMNYAMNNGYDVGKYKDVMYTTTGDALDNRYAYRYRRGQRLIPFSCLDLYLATLSVYQIITYHNPAVDGEFWTLGNVLKTTYKNKAAVGLRLRSRFPGKTKEYMTTTSGISDLLNVYDNILKGNPVNVHWSASNKVENKEVKKELDSSMKDVCSDYKPMNNNFVRIFVFTDRAVNQCGATVFDPFFATFKKRHAKYGVAVATPIVGESSYDTNLRKNWYDENKPLSVNVKYLFERDESSPQSHIVVSEDVKHWDGSQSAGKLLLMSLLVFMNYDYTNDEELMKAYRLWGVYTRERIFSVMVLMDGTVVQEFNCQNSGDIFTTGSNTLGNLFDNMYLNHAAYAGRSGIFWKNLEVKAIDRRVPHIMKSTKELEWERSVDFSRKIRLYGAGDNFLVAFPNLRGITKLIDFRADKEVLKLLNRNIKLGEGGMYYHWKGCEFFSQVLSSVSDEETEYMTLDSPAKTMLSKAWHLKKPLKYHNGRLHRESQMKLAGFLISYMFLSVPRKNLYNMFRMALNHYCTDVLNVDIATIMEDDYWSMRKYEQLLKYKVGDVTVERMFSIRFGSPILYGGEDIDPPSPPVGRD